MTSSTKDEGWDMAGIVRYTHFSGSYDKFGEWKENTKAIARHKGILKYLAKEVYITTEDEAKIDEEKLKIYEGNSKAWYFLIIRLTEIPFGMVRQCFENAHDAWEY